MDSNVIVIASGKGGTGKSTVAVGLSAALARAGHRVLLIDADEGLRCLDLMLGMAESAVFDLGDVLAERCDIDAAVIPSSRPEGLFLLPAADRAGVMTDRAMLRLIDRVKTVYDYVIIDSTAGIGAAGRAAACCAGRALVVVTPDRVSIRDAAGVKIFMSNCGVTDCRLVVNRFDYSLVKNGLLSDIDSMIDQSGLRLLGVVPYDTAILPASVKGVPVSKGHAARAFDRIAARLTGKSVKLPRLKKI